MEIATPRPRDQSAPDPTTTNGNGGWQDALCLHPPARIAAVGPALRANPPRLRMQGTACEQGASAHAHVMQQVDKHAEGAERLASGPQLELVCAGVRW